MVNEGLQGPGYQVVVMIKEARVALLLGLVQVLVVAASVQLPCKRWCLRHVVLPRERGQTQEPSVRTFNFFSDRYFITDTDAGWPNDSKISLRHKHRQRRFVWEMVWTWSTPFLLWIPAVHFKLSGFWFSIF